MKTISPKDIGAICEQLRDAGATIVFTHGIFDLLHPGHINHFRRARDKGTHLIVGLNTDESARMLYGPERPLIALEDRAEVVAAMEMVSYVTWFNEESPERLIQSVKPDVILQSGDDPADVFNIVQRIVRLPRV